MQTPSHAILNLVCFSQTQRSELIPVIVAGALLPDLPMFVMYFWAKGIRRQSEQQIWEEIYWSDFWQTWVALFHSIPLAVLGAIAATLLHQSALQVLFISMVLHSLGDLPVHNDDAHRHFFPLTNYRFISPVSYWDRRHYGAIVAPVEKLLVLAASLYLWPSVNSPMTQFFLIIVNLLNLSSTLYFRFIRHKIFVSVETPLEF